jgi:hypothetical protein
MSRLHTDTNLDRMKGKTQMQRVIPVTVVNRTTLVSAHCAIEWGRATR